MTIMMLEIVSPSVEEQPDIKLSRDERDEIKRNYMAKRPWKEVFMPIKDIEKRDKLVDLFEYLENKKNNEEGV